MEKKDLRDSLPTLKSIASDVDEIRQSYWNNLGQLTAGNLKRNNFEACYVETRQQACEKLLSLIPEEAVIGCGDSHTLFALEVEDQLKEEKKCTIIPHLCALNSQAYENEEAGYIKIGDKKKMREILMQYLVSDVFILSANAITLDGQIINVDGTGNRIAGSLYGPDRIIVVAGVNKIVPDEKAGRERIGFTAAPMNNIKYDGYDIPCVKTGNCRNCSHENRICNITTVIHKKPDEADFHVILIGEEMGF